jgi:hypothetical protein
VTVVNEQELKANLQDTLDTLVHLDQQYAPGKLLPADLATFLQSFLDNEWHLQDLHRRLSQKVKTPLGRTG